MATAAPLFPSDSLARWRELIATHQNLNLGFSELVQVPIVVDASGALADLRWIVARRNDVSARTALEETVAAGTVVAYAPPWLESELEEKLPLIATRYKLPLTAFRQAWERYRSSLRFYEPATDNCSTAVDPKDVPYRELSKELGGIVVYTNDHHLKAMGVQAIWFPELILLRNFARAASSALSLKAGGTIALIIAGAPVVALVRTGARLIARLPPPVQIALALGSLWAVLHPKGRALLAGAATSPKLEPVKRVVTKYADELGKSLLTAAESWGAVKGALPDRKGQPLLAHARAICAAAQGPVSESAIERGVKQAGYVSRSRTFLAYLRRTLRADSRFVEGPKGFWTVTRVLGDVSSNTSVNHAAT